MNIRLFVPFFLHHAPESDMKINKKSDGLNPLYQEKMNLHMTMNQTQKMKL